MYKGEPESSSGVGGALLDFTQAVSAISSSHKDLQKKIEDLDFKLTEKNRALEGSLGETQWLKTYLDCILDSMANCLVVIDRLGRITVFNKAAERLTGYEAKDIYGVDYSEVFGNKTSEQFTPFHILKTGRHFTEGEKEIRAKDGKRIAVKYSTSLLTDTEDRILGAIEVFTDLSAIRALDEQMHKLNILTALTDMAAVVAHEIRNPLSGIGGYAALLACDLDKDDPKREMAERIVEGVKRLDEIVNNLLLLTRTKKPSLIKAELGPFLERFTKELSKRVDLSTKKIILEKNIPDKPIKVQFDPTLMEQALMKIVDNAVQAMAEGGTLRIMMTEVLYDSGKSGNKVVINITDTGVGMSRETLERIFAPFFTTRERGVGLGLAIAKNLVKFQHCNIHVESVEGVGTSVMISLPVIEE